MNIKQLENITLTTAEIKTILDQLSEAPAKYVFDSITIINNAIITQSQALGEAKNDGQGEDKGT